MNNKEENYMTEKFLDTIFEADKAFFIVFTIINIALFIAILITGNIVVTEIFVIMMIISQVISVIFSYIESKLIEIMQDSIFERIEKQLNDIHMLDNDE